MCEAAVTGGHTHTHIHTHTHTTTTITLAALTHRGLIKGKHTRAKRAETSDTRKDLADLWSSQFPAIFCSVDVAKTPFTAYRVTPREERTGLSIKYACCRHFRDGDSKKEPLVSLGKRFASAIKGKQATASLNRSFPIRRAVSLPLRRHCTRGIHGWVANFI